MRLKNLTKCLTVALWIFALTSIDAPPAKAQPATPVTVSDRPAVLTTVAYRVHNMPEMVTFFTEAFGAEFREVDARGITSQFGEIGAVTLKFVPIRADVEFENFPIHQLGFEVGDVQAVLDAAIRHGGQVQDAPQLHDGRVHAAIRDPDGNTIEIYGRAEK